MRLALEHTSHSLEAVRQSGVHNM